MKTSGYLITLIVVIGAILIGFVIPFIITGLNSEGRHELVVLRVTGTAEANAGTTTPSTSTPLRVVDAEAGASALPNFLPVTGSTLTPTVTIPPSANLDTRGNTST